MTNGLSTEPSVDRSLNISELAKDFSQARPRCVTANRFLSPQYAAYLSHGITCCTDWGLRMSDGYRVMGLPPASYRELSPADKQHFAEIAYKAARDDFAFFREELWETWTGGTSSDIDDESVFGKFLRFAQSGEFLGVCSEMLGGSDVSLVRATAERYSAGHFYGVTKGQPTGAEIGFTIDLTAEWELEWGGLFQILDNSGGCTNKIYAPRINSFTLYELSARRTVSFVNRLARRDRYSISGFLHCKTHTARAGSEA